MNDDARGTLLSPNPVKPRIHVADIKCRGKWGDFTTQVVTTCGEEPISAIYERISDLEKLGNKILLVIPFNS